MRSVFLLLAFSSLVFGQTAQPTPQQVVSLLVTDVSKINYQVTMVLNQIPELNATIEKQEKQIAELQAEIKALKSEKVKK